MSESGSAEKSHEPTEKRIADAMREGQVPNSREVVTAGSLVAIWLGCSLLASRAGDGGAAALATVWEQADRWRVGEPMQVGLLSVALLERMTAAMVPVLALIAAGGLLGSLVQLPRAAAKRIRPDASRLSPAKGFARLFGKAGLFEFAKSVLKIAVVASLAAWAVAPTVLEGLATLRAPVQTLPHRAIEGVVLLAGWIASLASIIAVGDIVWTRRQWRARLRMSDEEVKRELRQSEGDALAKGRRRSIARDHARRSMLARVPEASFVVANPTHFAVALRYDRTRDPAPVVVAKGKGHVALRIREIAERSGVPVREDKPLARALHTGVELNGLIPEAFYETVAALVRELERIDARSS